MSKKSSQPGAGTPQPAKAAKPPAKGKAASPAAAPAQRPGKPASPAPPAKPGKAAAQAKKPAKSAKAAPAAAPVQAPAPPPAPAAVATTGPGPFPRESCLAYEQILDALSQGLVVLDKDLRILLWNRWMEQHSRLLREQVLGKVLTDLFPDLVKKGFVWKVQSVLKLGNYAFFSQRLHRFLFPFPAANYLQDRYENMQQNAVLAPLRGVNGQVEHVCVSILDNTDTVMYQERLEDSTKRLEQMSQTDHLTQVANRRHLFDRLSQELSRVRRNRQTLSLAIVDVDHFKRVNDTHGHLCGDQVLVRLAGMLKASLRTYDLVGRYGGEEFCLVLPNTNLADAVALVERLRCQVADCQFEYGSLRLHITISAGVTCSEGQPDDLAADVLLSQADEALYRAKTSGRNQTEVAVCQMQ